MNAPISTTNREDDSVAPVIVRLSPLLMLYACVTVKAPDKPIEINLNVNVNVKQEVVVSLKKDAEDVINANPELFPK